MAKKGDRFIITIGEVFPGDPRYQDDGLYRVEGFKTLFFDDYGLSKLEKADHWIPVTQSLPAMREEVLVSAAGGVFIAWRDLDGIWRSSGVPSPWLDLRVVAWAPLPKAYEEGL